VKTTCISSEPTALITGAASGIGRATALRLSKSGWRCVVVDADAAALARLKDGWPMNEAPVPLPLVVDLTDAEQIKRLADSIPPLDALINNAGVSAGGIDALSDSTKGAAAKLLALNLAAPARLVDACERRLRPGARIVNVASGAGLRAIPWRGLYSPSKAGLIAQTRALAGARSDWTVTALSPGFVRTELVQHLIDSGRLDPSKAVAKIPLGRMAEPEDMAAALCFLAGSGARTLTGQLLVLDGGSSVYGGSEALPPARYAVQPLDLALGLHCVEIHCAGWRTSLDAWESSRATRTRAPDTAYPGTVDGSALAATRGRTLEAALEAARRFRARHDANASLTLLLPPDADDIAWKDAGDAAASQMLIATLAAEWGAVGLRINGLQLARDVEAADCLDLLDYMAGPRAQFLTGQVLRPHASAAPAQRTPLPS